MATFKDVDYITIAKAAALWCVSQRRVYKYLEDGRVEGAVRFGTAWMIPAGAQKPADPRKGKNQPPEKSFLLDLTNIIEATTLPMPGHDPDAIMKTLSEERLRLQYEAEIAYLRGDNELTKRCYEKTEGDDASRLRASAIAIAAAISLGDYPFYLEVEKFLKDIVEKNENGSISALADLCLATAYTGAILPNMVPDWIRDGDFSLLMPQAKPDAAYKRAKYFQCIGNFQSMLIVAQTALEFCEDKPGITFMGIYLRTACALACCGLRRFEEAKCWLTSALEIALPHGFITPFAESATAFGGLLEQCIELRYPEYKDLALKQWERTFVNWRVFHNHFTKDKITLILSLREYQMAQLVAWGVPYKLIAEQFHISNGRLKTIMHEIYGKLFVSNRKELAQYIL